MTTAKFGETILAKEDLRGAKDLDVTINFSITARGPLAGSFSYLEDFQGMYPDLQIERSVVNIAYAEPAKVKNDLPSNKSKP